MDNSTAAHVVEPRIPVNWWGITLRAIVAFVIILAEFPLFIAFSWMGNLNFHPLVMQLFMLLPILVIATVLLLLVAAWTKYVERKPFATTGLFERHHIAPGLFGGLFFTFIAYVLGYIPLIATGQRMDVDVWADMREASTGMAITGMIVAFIMVVAAGYLLQGIPEEVIYRGWLFNLTRERPVLTVIWTALAFMIIHLISNGGQESALDYVLYLVTPLGMGILGGALVVWKGNVWWSIGMHGGTHLLDWIFDMIYPVELTWYRWVSVGVALAVVGIAVLVFALRRPAGDAPDTRREAISENAL